MSKKTIARIFLVALFLGLGTIAYSDEGDVLATRPPSSTLDLAIHSSDYILIGHVSADEMVEVVAAQDESRNPHHRARISVILPIKGKPPKELVIEYDEYQGGRINHLYPGLDFLVFLNRNAEGWLLAEGNDPFRLALSHWPGSFPAEAESGERVRMVLRESLRNGPPLMKMFMLDHLAALGDKASIPLIRSVMRSPGFEFQPQALNALIRLGDAQAVVEGIAAIEQKSKQKPPDRSWSDWIGPALSDIRDPEALPHLIRALRVDDVPLRKGAVYALREIRSRAAVPALVAALDDAEEFVRYQALMALYFIAKEDGPRGAPAIDEFQANPGRYLDYWHRWWRDKGSTMNWEPPATGPAVATRPTWKIEFALPPTRPASRPSP
ncbi:MAG: HEAT repeat domain-containing protein [Phycisphaerae bacterium]